MSPVEKGGARLSVRENRVLELASDGKTDHQIAAEMMISSSTVNSYWIRIRGKLGQRSRTELVAIAIRAEAQLKLEEALSRTKELEALLLERSSARAHEIGDMGSAAMRCLPEAVAVLDSVGIVVFSNDRLDELFDYPAGDLLGMWFSKMVPYEQASLEAAEIEGILLDPHFRRMGYDSALYGVTRDDTQLRVLLSLNRQQPSEQMRTIVIVRSFNAEVELIGRAQAASPLSSVV